MTRAAQRGFTLGEALTALAIASIGLSLAVPGLQSLAGSNVEAAAVNELVATLHLARSEAITRNARVAVCTSGDGEHCDDRPWEQGWIAFLDDDADGSRAPAEALVGRVSGLQGVEVRSAEFAHAFAYRPNGRVIATDHEAGAGEFSFCEPGAATASRVVIVRPTGLPALTDSWPQNAAPPCPG